MQRAGHVEAGVAAVGLKPTYFAEVSAPTSSRKVQRHLAHANDRAPALDADQPGLRAGLRQPAQLLQAPGALSWTCPETCRYSGRSISGTL